MMLHTKYQDSRPCGFREDFIFSLYKPNVKHVNSGVVPFFGPRGIIRTNLVEDH